MTCDTGYDLVGPPEITCKADGSWTDDTVCQIKGMAPKPLKFSDPLYVMICEGHLNCGKG